MLNVVETLRQLIQIPSVNPMGRPLDGPIYYEAALTDHLQQIFGRLGVAWERTQVAPRRDNIVARIEGATPLAEGGELLLLEVHQDTVPIDGMTIDPFAAEQRDGRIYGRGACDVKGGMAAMLAAFSRLATDSQAPEQTVVLACSVNEEHGFTGATALAQGWRSGSSQLLPRRPDRIIVAEPTSLQVVAAHKGVVRWKCRTEGRAAHSSRPDRGENAIYKMAPVLQALQRYHREVTPTLASHKLVGRPSLSVGVIAGGVSVNTVPDACVIEIDRRLLPGHDPLAVQQEVISYLEDQGISDCVHEQPFITARGLPDSGNETLAQQVRDTVRRMGIDSEIEGVQYGTDAPALAADGSPAVVFGPGHIEQAHTIDEWIEIEQLEKAAEAYYRLATNQ
jgi:acetylornithine deacetylase/succinyl-diaminopimelate desuccinylase family protein